MPLIRGSSRRFIRRSGYTLPGMKETIPSVTKRISLVTSRSGPRSGMPTPPESPPLIDL